MGAKSNFILNFMHFKSLKKKILQILKIHAFSLKKTPSSIEAEIGIF